MEWLRQASLTGRGLMQVGKKTVQMAFLTVGLNGLTSATKGRSSRKRFCPHDKRRASWPCKRLRQGRALQGGQGQGRGADGRGFLALQGLLVAARPPLILLLANCAGERSYIGHGDSERPCRAAVCCRSAYGMVCSAS